MEAEGGVAQGQGADVALNQHVSWRGAAGGEDSMLVELDNVGAKFLGVKDVRSRCAVWRRWRWPHAWL